MAGAVYRPAEEIVPHEAPLQPVPVRVHVTLVLVEPVTVAMNCCVLPAATLTAVGEIVTATGITIVTVAVADFVGSAFEATLTVTCEGVGIAAGAMYMPDEDTVPHAEPLQPLPLTLQVTLLLPLPFTVARNC